MKNNIIADVTGLLLLIFAVGVIAALFLGSTDSDIQTRIKDRASKFTDTARATGKIEPSEYMEFATSIGNCGEFEVTIKVSRNISYQKTDGSVESSSVSMSQAEVLAYMFPEGSATEKAFPLNNGDRVNVVVRRTGPGLTSLLSLFGRGGKEGDLICEYSGQVYRTGS